MTEQQADKKPLDTLDDDFLDEIEITNLEPLQTSTRIKPLQLPRLTPRQRRLSLILTTIVGVLIVGGMLVSISNMRWPIFQPAPTATVAAIQGHFYLSSNPGWGRFTIDGQPVTPVSGNGQDQATINTQAPMSLPPGSHQISWHAAPFKAQSCTLQVSATAVLTGCNVSDNSVQDTATYGAVARVVFAATMDDLPANQQASLADLLQKQQAKITFTENVAAGELYAVNKDVAQANCRSLSNTELCYAQASQPLLATLKLHLNTSGPSVNFCMPQSGCVFNGQNCPNACVTSDFALEKNAWTILIAEQPLWSYTTLTGQVIASDQPASFFGDTGGYQSVNLTIGYNSQGWYTVDNPDMIGQTGNLICNQAFQDIQQIATPSLFRSMSYGYSTQSGMDLPALKPALADCLLNIGGISANGTSTPTTNQEALVLERFGVLLAVNAVAQHNWPDLPLADASEQQIAQTLASTISSSP